ncbi:MAG: beta-N-acetylhexosaminidase [Myxococcales bacterium]|nr:beta-N-acetylhexosaminidase [Myxococcales bacterium]
MVSPWQPGQLLFCGFIGVSPPRSLLDLIAAGRVGGVVLFRRNVENPAQLRQLCDRLHAAAPPGVPLLLAIDQEGGRVLRLRAPWTAWPAARALGDRDEPQETASIATAMARELVELGIRLDFAPVVDVDTNPQNPVIGDRSFGRAPERVARHATAFLTALQEGGVAACAKHFPGHGDTALDSHLALPRIDHDRARIDAVELPPFRAAIEAGVASIMTAHVVFAAIDPRAPATLSPAVMAVLREELGYDGVVFSDDLEMRAIADFTSVRGRIEGPLRAGVDALLLCEHADLQEEALRIVERLPDAAVEAAITRVVALKRRFAAPRPEPPSGPPYPEHQALARKLAR